MKQLTDFAAAFDQNLSLDIKLVYAGFVSKFDGEVMYELTKPDTADANEAILRTRWLQTQPLEYINDCITGAAVLIAHYIEAAK